MESTEHLLQMLVMSVLVWVTNIDVIADVLNTNNTIDGVTHFLLGAFRSTQETKAQPLVAKQPNMKLENANHYGLRTIMNLGRSINYESILRTADMNTLEHRRIEQSLIIFYKCYKENGPSYLADLFEPRITPYNLRNTGLNVTQNSYNSKFRHNSYSFVISRIWNKLPPSVKTAPNLSSFRRKLKTLIFTGCQCKSSL